MPIKKLSKSEEPELPVISHKIRMPYSHIKANQHKKKSIFNLGALGRFFKRKDVKKVELETKVLARKKLVDDKLALEKKKIK